MASNLDFIDKIGENIFSSKNFKKVYWILAIWLVISPLLDTLCQCIGLTKMIITVQFVLICCVFIFVKFFESALNVRKISFKNKTIITWLCLALFVWCFIASKASNAVSVNFLLSVCFFVIFALILDVDKTKHKKLAMIFSIVMIIDSFMWLCDLNNTIIPCFDTDDYAMSMQFFNPNWSGFVVIIACAFTLWFIEKQEKIWQKALWFAGFVVMILGLFVGGSYSPEFSLFLLEVAMLIFFWIKNKKCPYWILSAFLTTIFISFFVWMIPPFAKVSTANANFFYETLAVIDGKLGTHLVKGVSTFFNKLFGGKTFDGVKGSDGWGRDDLLARSFKQIFSSAKCCIVGSGVGFIDKVRVHNCFVVMWLEFGLVGLLLYLGIIVSIVIRFIRVQKNDRLVFLFMAFAMMLFEEMFCCIELHCYMFFVVLVAILCKELYTAPLRPKRDKNKQEHAELEAKDTQETDEEKIETQKEVVAK